MRCGDQGLVVAREILLRGTADDADDLIARRLRFGIEPGLIERRPAFAAPMAEEQALQLRHRRPFDSHRKIAPVFRLVCLRRPILGFSARSRAVAGRLALVVAGEIDAADDCDLAIDNHDLAMIAVVGRVAAGDGFQGIDRMEREQVGAG